MEIRRKIAPASQWATDALIFFVFENKELTPGLGEYLGKNAPALLGSGALADVKGQLGRVALLHTGEGAGSPRILAAGLGKPEETDAEKLRQAVAAAAAQARSLELPAVGLPVSALSGLGLDAPAALEESLAGFSLSLYRYDALKTEPAPEAAYPSVLEVLAESELSEDENLAVSKACAQIAGVVRARDMINTPANLATPAYLADQLRQIADTYGFQCDTYGAEAISEMGMGCFESVFKGAGNEARLVVVDTAPNSKEAPVALVGKGVTFDTGGICLKPPLKMHEMKADMGGAAAVAGVLEASGMLPPGPRILAVIPLAENMPGSTATRPGDVATSLSGKTVEIINTDAEGRLLLCDAITYAGKFAPRAIVDLATLTGACVVALGPKVAGLFCNDDALSRRVLEAGERVGEPFWPMPLWDLYAKALESDAADLKNVGPREGGAVHAAVFLKQFVPKDTPWAHLDIAGPAWADEAYQHVTKGGAGFGVRTLFSLLRSW